MTPLLHHHLGRRAEQQAEAVAVVGDNEQLTYGELAARSDDLAAVLSDHGLVPGDRVGLLVPKGPSAIVAMHATLKAGALYVPLDTESPPPRLSRILAAAEPKVLLVDHTSAPRLEELAKLGPPLPTIGSVDAEPFESAGGTLISAFSGQDYQGAGLSPPTVRVDPDAPAHLLFTSGSTGEPKGVVITHRNVDSFIAWALKELGTRPGDQISGHPPLHFDLSTFDIYGTFAAGAALHLVPAKLSLNPRALAAFIRDRQLTQWFSVPSVLTYMAKFDAVADDDFPALERLLWCGEVLPTPVLGHWMERLPHVRFTNLYGPTEATIASSYHHVPSMPLNESEPIPIGVACDGEELLVLDDQLVPVQAGEVGDLYIAGAGLSPGYWRDEAKTEAAFLPDPRVSPGAGAGGPVERIYRTGDLARRDQDGLIYFLGRADSQIKSRGYRIELGEIETALNTIDGIRECAVVGAHLEDFGGTAICAAYVAGAGPSGGAGSGASPEAAPVEPPQLRKELASSLPMYMLPARWLRLDVLPKNANGKIDRPALRQRFAEDQATKAPPAGTRIGPR